MFGRLICWLVAIALCASACASDLTADLNGKPCDVAGLCLPGYECDQEKQICLVKKDEPAPGAGSCEDGETRCGEECTVLASDDANCGGCNTMCSAPPHGVAVCVENDCAFACSKGYTACGSVCLDVQIDPQNCGACGKSCPEVDGAAAACQGGVCQLACRPPFEACSGECVEKASDPNHCGACAEVCPFGEVCSNGECKAE